MIDAAGSTYASRRRAISSWRLVGGAYLHFAVPAYLISTPLAALFLSPAHASIATMIASVPRLSAFLLGGYAMLAACSVVVALVVEPLLRFTRLPVRSTLAK